MNVGRTGSLNPFANLEPVIVAHATVKLATLHNEDDIRRKDIREGDIVIVQRAGEVIPQVVGPVVSKRTGAEKVFEMPANCPACQTPVVRPAGEAMRYCPNRACPAQIFRLLCTFAAQAMDIEGMGESLCDQLLRSGLVKDLADVFYLSLEDLLGLERIGEKTARKLLDNIEKSKNTPLSLILFGLGIRHVGFETAELLAGHFGSIDALGSASARRAGLRANDRSQDSGECVPVPSRRAESGADREDEARGGQPRRGERRRRARDHSRD